MKANADGGGFVRGLEGGVFDVQREDASPIFL